MNLLICVDDTDDVSKKTSTGKIAGIIGRRMIESGGTINDGISRHQLLLSGEVKYTSHNSSMCIGIEMPLAMEKSKLIIICEEVILSHKSETANPGLAICFVDEIDSPEQLIQYGFDAKKTVMTKKNAYNLAADLPWIYLKELGGDGTGIIGALAGIGLRLSRCDGAIRGRIGEDIDGAVMPVSEFCQRYGAECVVAMNGGVLDDEELVRIDAWARMMFYDGHKCCLAVKNRNDRFYTLISHHQDREQLFHETGASVCSEFVFDNDEEECVSLGTQACFNCLYRRWVRGGFECMNMTS